MTYVLYSTPVQLRSMEIHVPPISLYHMRKLLEIRDSGVDIDNPDSAGLRKIIELVAEVVQENHPEITADVLEKQLDAANIQSVMTALQSMPKNVTAQTGKTQAAPVLSEVKPETSEKS